MFYKNRYLKFRKGYNISDKPKTIFQDTLLLYCVSFLPQSAWLWNYSHILMNRLIVNVN